MGAFLFGIVPELSYLCYRIVGLSLLHRLEAMGRTPPSTGRPSSTAAKQKPRLWSNDQNVANMNKVKQLPYGVSDFEYVMRGNLYYVDKTMYIPQIEAQPNYLMFIRPRRFGKSLLLSMLKTYYDKAKK